MRISDLIIALATAQAEVGNVEVMHAHSIPASIMSNRKEETVFEAITSVETDRIADQHIVWFGV